MRRLPTGALGEVPTVGALPPAFPTWLWGMQILQEQISIHAVVADEQKSCAIWVYLFLAIA